MPYHPLKPSFGLFRGATVFYVANLETVPESGRRRFNWMSRNQELLFARYALTSELKQCNGKILPNMSSEVVIVRKVMDALIQHIGVRDEGGPWRYEWVLILLRMLLCCHDRSTRFTCIPIDSISNKIFVLKGLLGITQNEDGLATILGHGGHLSPILNHAQCLLASS